MSKNQSAARQQRRLYEKFLKKFHPAQYTEYKSGVLERGRKIHQENVEAVRKAEEARYEEIQNRMILEMREQGKSNEEIDSFFAGVVQAVIKERTIKESSLFMIFKSEWKEELLNQVKFIQL